MSRLAYAVLSAGAVALIHCGVGSISSTTAFWWGSTISTAQANYNGNLIYAGGAKSDFRQRTQSAGLKPNPWNVYGPGATE